MRVAYRLVIAGVVMSTVFYGDLGAAAKPAKGQSNMTLDLSIHLERTDFITGDSLPVEVELTNGTDSPVSVADPKVGGVTEARRAHKPTI